MKRNQGVDARLRDALLTTTMIVGVALAGGAMLADDAAAAGFALKEQSASAQGNSFAGATAGAEDVTYMFFNPAALARQDESQAAVVLSYIAPSNETTNATDGLGILPGASNQDAGVSALVPALYGMWSVSPNLKFGVGVNVPFGLSTEYDPLWQGAFHALESEIKSVNINPAVAVRLNEMISLGAGVQIQHFETRLTSFDGVGTVEVEGEDWGYGFNVGALIEFSPQTRVGLNYRSQIDHTLDGTATVPGSGLTDAGITADFTSPDTASIGLYHELSEQWAVMGEVSWTGWSTFQEYEVALDSGTVINNTPFEWEDVWFVGLGATWTPDENTTIRGGLAFDQSPIQDEFRTPRLPGADRAWASIGGQFSLSPSIVFDVGYTHVFVRDAEVDLAPGYSSPALPGFTADYESSVDILTMQVNFKF